MRFLQYLQRKTRLRTKMALGIVLVLLALGGGLALVISSIASEALLEENKTRGISSAAYLASRATEPLVTMDVLGMKNIVDEVVRGNKDVSYAFIQDRYGEPLAHTFTGGFPVDLKTVNPVPDGTAHRVRLLSTGDETLYDVAVPIVVGADRLGAARVGMSRAHARQVVGKLLWAIFLSTAAGILIAGTAGAALARTITKRVRLLHRSAEEIVKGNLDVSASPELPRQCWETLSCDKSDCPAYGNTRQRCWYLVGTLCQPAAEATYEDKIRNCLACRVYQDNNGDELQDLSEFFAIMALILRDRLQALLTTEASLLRQQQLFKTILDVTPDCVSLQDRELRFQAVNKAFCRMAAKGEREILGKTDADLFPSELALVNRKENVRIVATGQTLSAERTTGRKENTRWFHLVKTPVFDADGGVAGILCNSTDITEIKRLHEQVARSQKMESLGQLAAGVAHEINTPLGIILGNAQLLIEDAQPGSEAEAALRIIEKYARISKKIVADLLHFSRHAESVKGPLEVNRILEQVVAVVEHTFGLEHIRIERQLAPHLPPVLGDQEKLEQVFINLFNNARDAVGSDGLITVATAHDAAAEEVVVAIADTGHGIPPGIGERIFDPFFSTKGVGKGTGLGLSVTFGIVKDHGGRIDFESPPRTPLPGGNGGAEGRGAVFIVRLPVFRDTEREKERAALHGEDTGA